MTVETSDPIFNNLMNSCAKGKSQCDLHIIRLAKINNGDFFGVERPPEPKPSKATAQLTNLKTLYNQASDAQKSLTMAGLPSAIVSIYDSAKKNPLTLGHYKALSDSLSSTLAKSSMHDVAKKLFQGNLDQAGKITELVYSQSNNVSPDFSKEVFQQATNFHTSCHSSKTKANPNSLVKDMSLYKAAEMRIICTPIKELMNDVAGFDVSAMTYSEAITAAQNARAITAEAANKGLKPITVTVEILNNFPAAKETLKAVAELNDGTVANDNALAAFINNKNKPTTTNIKTNGLQVALDTNILKFVAAKFKKTDLKNVNGILICDKDLQKADFEACNNNLIKLDTTVCTTSLECDKILDQYIENVIWSPAATGNTDPQTNCQSSGAPGNCAEQLSGSNQLKFSALMTSETTDMTLDYSL